MTWTSVGTYRVRGDVIDIFPAESDREGVRVELFDDEIEELSIFRSSGEVLRKVPRLTIYPKTHYVTSKDRSRIPDVDIKAELKARLEQVSESRKLLKRNA